jgi:hypothetical protein
MPRLWLPLGKKPTGPPEDERAELIQRLRRITVMVPGAERSDMVELSQLREIVHWQEERERVRQKVDLLLPSSKLSRAEVKATLRDYLDYQRVRKAGSRRLY